MQRLFSKKWRHFLANQLHSNMSESSSSSSGSGMGFFVGFFALIIFAALFSQGGNSLLPEQNSGSSTTPSTAYTPSSNEPTRTTISNPEVTPPPPRLSDREVESRLDSLYRELNSLKEDLREAKLREPVSPYAGKVELESGNARDTNPEHEYLFLRASSGNTKGINVSPWYLESYVTDEVAAIPRGDRTIVKWRSPVLEDIVLLPGETAYVLTDYSPIDVSFHENRCTGYLREEETFYPSLYSQCPTPMDELKRVGTINLDDDKCYDFVERMQSCTVPDDDAIDSARLTGACRKFLDQNFGYNNCVAEHANDPYFDDVGEWHIYLGRDENLWRSERDIIQLKDENGLIVDVIEY
jgi:hypothetical protein